MLQHEQETESADPEQPLTAAPGKESGIEPAAHHTVLPDCHASPLLPNIAPVEQRRADQTPIPD